MNFLAILTLLFAVIATLTTAADRETTVVPPKTYYLQTKVVASGKHKDCGSNKNSLWLSSYHTGAGLGDATLVNSTSLAWPGHLNGTRQLFASNIGDWPLAIGWGPYQVYNLVTISIASTDSGTEGYYFDESGLQYNASYSGWLACDWWHGVPQLFNLNGPPQKTLPNSCSKVNLLPVAVDA